MRKLKNSIDLKWDGYKEFVHLRLININEFLNEYGNNIDYYESPFSVLAALEKEIKFQNKPKKCILISYKPDGDMIFDFVRIYERGNIITAEYEYRTSIS